MIKRHRTHILVLTVVLALLAAACSSDDSSTESMTDLATGLNSVGDDTTEVTSEAMAEEARSEGDTGGDAAEGSNTEDAATGEADLGSGALAQAETPIDLGRDIIYTAFLGVEVNDVAESTREATRIMQGFGGLLFGQQTSGDPDPRTTLIFRVLPDDFTDALDALGSIGRIRDQQVSADDVTERVVDLESRINTAAASVERLRLLLEGATNVSDIADLENQLLQRETNLETLRGQLRTVENQVDLATITLTITEATIRPEISVSVSSYPGESDQGLSCPGSSELRVEEGTVTTTCFEIRNVGDTPLTDIQLNDPVLEITLEDLTPVFIQPEEALEPGQSAVYFMELTADQTVRLQTRVSATPVDENGDPLPGRGVADTATATILALDPGGLPTFAEGLEGSWEALVTFGDFLLLAIGTIIPFLWIVPIIWLLRRQSKPNATVVTTSEPEPEAELIDA